jgi:hypothetical protein
MNALGVSWFVALVSKARTLVSGALFLIGSG